MLLTAAVFLDIDGVEVFNFYVTVSGCILDIDGVEVSKTLNKLKKSNYADKVDLLSKLGVKYPPLKSCIALVKG